MEATAHDVDVIDQNPQYLLLHYVKTLEHATDPPKPSWQSIAACAAMDSATQQCDEFPFYSTEEGLPTQPPDYRPISIFDNQSQGGKLGGFYNSCKPLQESPRGSPDRAFIFVPLPFLPLSFGICEVE